jgi:hypothetical protein
VLTVATAAYAVVLLVVLVLLGGPAAPLTARTLPGAALRGALVLSQLSDRRRARRAPIPLPRPAVPTVDAMARSCPPSA